MRDPFGDFVEVAYWQIARKGLSLERKGDLCRMVSLEQVLTSRSSLQDAAKE